MGCKVFRVGVFFDGTGNNKFVDAKADDGSASNIAKLYELYNEHHGEVKVAGYDKSLNTTRIYKEGIGTDKNRKDWNDDFFDRKSEKGAGGGGAKRIQEALDEVKILLRSHKIGIGADSYCERIIDVFGFSRGAAQARDFINEFYKRSTDTWKMKSVKIGFVGLYDTVGSFGIAGTEHNMKPLNPDGSTESAVNPIKLVTDSLRGVNEYGLKDHENDPNFQPYNFNLAQGSADTIVHMVAAHEVRKTFPLSSLLSIGKHSEYAFLGVHSDIGGGYADTEIEPHSYPLKTFVGDKRFTRKMFSNAEKEANAYALAEYNKLEANGKAAKGWKIKIKKPSVRDNSPEFEVICYRNREINNGLSKVTLNLMHREALQAGVPLKPMPSDKDHLVPDDLEVYYEYCQDLSNVTKWNSQECRDSKTYFDTYISDDLKKISEKHIGKKVEQACNNSDPFSSAYFKALQNKYSHHSAVDTAEGYSSYDGHTGLIDKLIKDSPDSTGGNDARYIRLDNGREIEVDPRKNTDYNDELIIKREIFENVQGKAIVPRST